MSKFSQHLNFRSVLTGAERLLQNMRRFKPGTRPKIVNHLKLFGSSVWNLAFPLSCAGCREVWLRPGRGFWCGRCLKELPWIESPFCVICGFPFLKSPSSPDHVCGECLLEEPPFDYARSAVIHMGVVRTMINALKFNMEIHWVRALAQLLTEAFRKTEYADIDYIIPVPLHRKRLQQRGFNQAALVSNAFGKEVGLPVRFDLLCRKQWTKPQTQLDRKERLENVKGAFQVEITRDVRARSVLLIDDVFTTGTTIRECSKTLKKAGAKRIYVMTISRAVPDLKMA